jgi:hypothetical protein
MYKYLSDPFGNNQSNVIKRIADGACIPFDPANADYQAFLRWCEEGNTPLPADEPTQGE